MSQLGVDRAASGVDGFFRIISRNRVTTGGDDISRWLISTMKYSIQHAKSIDFMVSFLMATGVDMLIQDLSAAVDRGVPVRILTGNYLGITQPEALYKLRAAFGDRIDLRFYNDRKRSFHAKAYFFHFDITNEVFVGSSNVSRSALSSGIEWNYRLTDQTDQEAYKEFFDTFEDLFYHQSVIIDDTELKRYSDSWHRPKVYQDIERADPVGEEKEILDGIEGVAEPQVRPLFQPRGAQIEALYALNLSRKEGADKALVQAATGIGKTYLAAFDSKAYDRVLFVAHREEILKQAAMSFHNVRPGDRIGFFDSDHKDTDAALIFASVETLGRSAYLDAGYFAPDAFDYIVIDEFHHAVTRNYRNIIQYFHPQFLLGLTATPERMDGRDIYELCDYNVPFELSLGDAINKGFLCPFHYYGIYDDTDYSKIHLVRGRYDEKELNEQYIGNVRRYDLIFKYYMKYISSRALGFCCSRQHAEDMAREFCGRGVPSAAVYSGETGPFAKNRQEALADFRAGKLRVIFSVDMFNEGLDVPCVDMVMFLRPTDSPVVFLQQLGRGLRKSPGKEYLTVLDFIGNYERASQLPELLTGRRTGTGDATGERIRPGDYPDDCVVDFDMRLIDLFKEMKARSLSVTERIDTEADRVRDVLEHIPSRIELFNGMDEEIYTFCLSHTRANPFRDYLAYKQRRGWLSLYEKRILNNAAGRDFLRLISQTAMTKVYKMPILSAFYNGGKPIMAVTDEQVLKAWKTFFNAGTNWKDFDPKLTREEYQKITDRQHLKKAYSMPIHFLLKSGSGFFVEKEGYALALRDDLRPMMENPAFSDHFGDIIRYRTTDYYRRRYTQGKR